MAKPAEPPIGVQAEVNAPVLALRPRDAARALGIGSRKLWELSQPRGPIPCVRIGACVVYPVAALERWLASQIQSAGPSTGQEVSS